VISSQDVVLVDDVGSFGARTKGRRFVLYDRARKLADVQLDVATRPAAASM